MHLNLQHSGVVGSLPRAATAVFSMRFSHSAWISAEDSDVLFSLFAVVVGLCLLDSACFVLLFCVRFVFRMVLIVGMYICCIMLMFCS